MNFMKMAVQDEKEENNVYTNRSKHKINISLNLSPLSRKENSAEKGLMEQYDDTYPWQESRIEKKMVINQNIDNYVSSFTMHGLSRIFKGSRSEKVLWSVLVVGGLIMATIITYGLIKKYFSYNVYTEISANVTNRYQMPSITFCEGNLKEAAQYAYCGFPPTHRFQEEYPCVNQTVNLIAKNVTTLEGHWSNGLFTVLSCYSSGILYKCHDHKFLKSSSRLNNSCFTWNYDGTLFSNLFESTDITFIFNRPSHMRKSPEVIAYVHEPGSQNDFSRSINLMPLKTTKLTLDKTIIKRLPSPFPSNCTLHKSGDIFPGNYSRMSCLKSLGILNLYMKCGGAFDYATDLIPDKIRYEYKTNKTIKEMMGCYRDILRTYENEGFSKCPLPCMELDLDISQSVLDDILEPVEQFHPYIYSVILYFPRPGTYKIMQEKELYPWDQIACELGGFVGIALGCSLLSLFEIIVCLILSLTKWFI